MTHNPRQWDDGEKSVLGETGNWNGADVIDILFRQEAAARYIPAKLWTFFVHENPPADILDALAKTFRRSGFKTGPVLRKILLSEAFYDPAVRRTQIKSPIEFLVQLFKQLGLDSVPDRYVLSAQQQLGQTLFMPPNVAGWDWGKAWINTNTLLARYNVAGFVTGAVTPGSARRPERGAAMEMEMEDGDNKASMARRRRAQAAMHARGWQRPDYSAIAPGELRKDPEKLVAALVTRFFQGEIPEATRQTFLAFAQPLATGGLRDAELAELCHLMLSTPHYQLT